ncbi:hypothetical protein NIES2107_47810 [Nostoc carneum NIES-2107]|nr:hypothetical protein NIES2107_47810 [Nostoc carneum NIES-2107]
MGEYIPPVGNCLYGQLILDGHGMTILAPNAPPDGVVSNPPIPS